MSDARRRVLVTGSSRGIGRAIALRLAADGFAVTVHGRAPSTGAEATLAELRRRDARVTAVFFDVADRAAARAALEAEIAAHGAFYGVVLNAGLARDAVFPALSGEDWDAVLRADLDGFYNVLAPLAMPMIRLRTGGRIVAIGSVAGVLGNRGQVNYSAAKAGLIGAVRALALELASRRITVNCVAPGLIRTDMLARAPLAELLKQVPAGRLGEPEEVAGLVAWLCSDAAGYVTRQVLAIDGGLT